MNPYQKEILKLLPSTWKQKKVEWEGLLEVPKDSSLGDYAVSCFSLGRAFKAPPQNLAQEIAQTLKPTSLISRIENIGPYINFFINTSYLVEDTLKTILTEKEKFGSSTVGQNQTVIIEYSSPNIAKPFHIGHLRSTIIGQSLCNIHKFLGDKTIAINHLGDWGTQFGKLIYAFKKWGNEEEYEKKGIPYLHELYVQFHQMAKENPELEEESRLWFKKCEENDPEALGFWKSFKGKSLEEFEKIYKRLGVSFDFTLGESFYTDKMEAALKEIQNKKLLKESEGALIVDLEKYEMPPCLLKKKDGATLYATRDLAAASYRYNKHHFSKMIYIVAADQTLHFQQIFKVLELMGYEWAKNCIHIPFGLIGFKEGKMSTREGKVILLEEVLDRAQELALKNIEEKNPNLSNKEEISEQVGIGAIIFSDLSQKMIKNVTFDWNEILNFDGETGPYLQYTYARASSILRKSQEKYSVSHFSLLKEELEVKLIKTLFIFPIILESTIKHLEPSILAKYLLDVAKEFNRFYLNHKVIVEDLSLHKARLSLVTATCYVLGNGMRLLNMETPHEM